MRMTLMTASNVVKLRVFANLLASGMYCKIWEMLQLCRNSAKNLALQCTVFNAFANGYSDYTRSETKICPYCNGNKMVQNGRIWQTRLF